MNTARRLAPIEMEVKRNVKKRKRKEDDHETGFGHCIGGHWQQLQLGTELKEQYREVIGLATIRYILALSCLEVHLPINNLFCSACPYTVPSQKGISLHVQNSKNSYVLSFCGAWSVKF